MCSIAIIQTMISVKQEWFGAAWMSDQSNVLVVMLMWTVGHALMVPCMLLWIHWRFTQETDQW